MSYLELLNLILSYGDRIPQIMAAVQKLLADAKALWELIKPADAQPSGGDLQLFEADAATLEAEGKLAYAMSDAGTQAAFDFTLLRSLFMFAKEHPEMLALLWKLFKKS